jgi:hypothetical protein
LVSFVVKTASIQQGFASGCELVWSYVYIVVIGNSKKAFSKFEEVGEGCRGIGDTQFSGIVPHIIFGIGNDGSSFSYRQRKEKKHKC